MNRLKVAFDNNLAVKASEIKYIFKTWSGIMGIPIHFTNKIENADIYYGNKDNIESKIVIKPIAERFNNNPDMIQADYFKSKLILKFERKTNPVVQEHNQIIFNEDIVYSSLYMLTGANEKYVPKVKWDRHDITESFLYKKDILHRPVVNETAAILKNIFNEFEYLSPWPEGKKYAIALSHDVDYPEIIRGIEGIRWVLTKRNFRVLKNLKNKDQFWLFKEWIDLERKYNTKSAFYFCSFRGNLLRYFLKAPDTFYNVSKNKFKKVADQIIQKGSEIGLHSSFFAFKSEEGFQKEVDDLNKAFDIQIKGNRHHYWHLDQNAPYKTCLTHEKVGLEYDSSIGFERHSGFRYGIATPYHIYHQEQEKALDIIQIPPVLMDDHLFGHFHLSKYNSWKEQIDDILKKTLENQSLLTIDYHVRVLNNFFFPDWGKSYEYLLKKINEANDFYNDTPLNISRSWRKYEETLNEYFIDETNHIN